MYQQYSRAHPDHINESSQQTCSRRAPQDVWQDYHVTIGTEIGIRQSHFDQERWEDGFSIQVEGGESAQARYPNVFHDTELIQNGSPHKNYS